MKAISLAVAVVVALFTSSVRAEVAAPPPANAPTIKLVDAGKDAKKPLRFTAKKGLKKTMTMTMTMSMSMTMGKTTVPPQTIPPIRMQMAMKVVDVSATGDIKYDFELKKPEIVADKSTPAAVVAAMKDAVKGMSGITGYAVVSNRGFTREADIKIPDNVNPQTRQMLESVKQSISQISAPVPEEAVGVGAKWETSTKVDQNGLVIDQIAQTELTKLAGNKATMKIVISQNAKPQKITSNGVSVDLESYSASGGGETTLDMAGLVPTNATVALKSNMKMKSMGQPMSMTLDLTMAMKSK